MGVVYPFSDAEEDVASVQNAVEWDVFWNLDLLFNGRYGKLAQREHVAAIMPAVHEGDLDIIATPSDFLGINHYRANWSKHSDQSPFGFQFVWGQEPCEEQNGIGWPVTPDSMYGTLKLVHSRFPGLKLYVTENGYADSVPPGTPLKTHDPERIRFLERYIAGAHKAMEEGVNLHGYMVWSLLDNLEWSSGFEPRFGIIAVDMDTGERTLKDSARWYREFLETRELVIG